LSLTACIRDVDTADAMSSEESSDAGGSARQKAERLHAQYDELRGGRGGLGRAFTALFPSELEKRLLRDEHNWRTGAQGERNLAAFLTRRCPSIVLLNDRRAPTSRGNVDHIAVALSGVYVIDCKRYRGKVEVRRPLFGKEQLRIKGRDRTALIDGLEKQVAQVKAVLVDLPEAVPVRGCLCFVAPEGFVADSGLPALRTLMVRGYPLYFPKRAIPKSLWIGAVRKAAYLPG
jgi:Nuclease-related domain